MYIKVCYTGVVNSNSVPKYRNRSPNEHLILKEKSACESVNGSVVWGRLSVVCRNKEWENMRQISSHVVIQSNINWMGHRKLWVSFCAPFNYCKPSNAIRCIESNVLILALIRTASYCEKKKNLMYRNHKVHNPVLGYPIWRDLWLPTHFTLDLTAWLCVA